MTLESLFESFENSAIGPYLIPIIYAAIGVSAVLLATGFVARFLRRRIERVRAAETTRTMNRLLRNDGELLLKLMGWVRWGAIVLIVALSFAMLLENISEVLLQSSKLKTAALAIQKADAKFEKWVRTVGRAFWMLLFLFVMARVIENAFHAVISRYVAQQHEPRALARMQTLNLMSSYFVRTVVFVIGMLTVLQTFGFDIAPLLATAGVASVAIGFGAQSLVKDVLAGFFILLEDQFAVGDTIAVDDKVGKVESMTLRITRLRAADGQVIVIPNSEIKTVRNTTTGWAQFEFQIGIRYDQNPDQALSALVDELTRLQQDKNAVMLPMPEVAGIAKLADAVVLRAYVRTLPDKKWEVERELHHRVLMRFKREGIQTPQQSFVVTLNEVKKS